MRPKNGDEFTLAVPLFVEKLFKQLLGNESSVGEAIRPATYFYVHVAVFGDFAG